MAIGKADLDGGGSYCLCIKYKANTAWNGSCLLPSHTLTDFWNQLTGSAVPSFKTTPYTSLLNSYQAILEVILSPSLNVMVFTFEAETEVICLESDRSWVVEMEIKTLITWCWFDVHWNVLSTTMVCVQCFHFASVFGFIVKFINIAYLVSC